MIKPVTFKAAQPDTIKYQVKQVMRDEQKTYEDLIFDNCTKKLNEKYMDEFNVKINDARNNLTKQDKITVLSMLKDAYNDAGMKKDAAVIDAQIGKLNVEA